MSSTAFPVADQESTHIPSESSPGIYNENTTQPGAIPASAHRAYATAHQGQFQEYNTSGPRTRYMIPPYNSSFARGGRSYDYEEKYDPDPLGDEMKENARVWKVYLDEAESHDFEMMTGFRDTIDALLVFAALFSAVVTSFIIAAISSLQPFD
ncbi:hypothetical protein F5880DRAFT_1511005 [Lentinula raphanica]|nr:hypothetical protein F5880DRAFT_1511005 [Lentinula raphanica]